MQCLATRSNNFNLDIFNDKSDLLGKLCIIYVHVCMNVRVCACVYVCVCMRVCMCLCLNVPMKILSCSYIQVT